ncbi:hypothetical protein BRAS3809_7720011 [Bradyrhizobium sp. STM 3809]|nr:hypothetical protein BRAS3809_7720011 [Bradyrhizobium sp. STM 3809]
MFYAAGLPGWGAIAAHSVEERGGRRKARGARVRWFRRYRSDRPSWFNTFGVVPDKPGNAPALSGADPGSIATGRCMARARSNDRASNAARGDGSRLKAGTTLAVEMRPGLSPPARPAPGRSWRARSG